MSWTCSEDVLRDYNAMSCMTAHTPMEYVIGFSTPESAAALDNNFPEPPAPPRRRAPRQAPTTGRGALIDELRTELSSQRRVELSLREQLRKSTDRDYSNASIEKNFCGNPVPRSVTPVSPVLRLQSQTSAVLEAARRPAPASAVGPSGFDMFDEKQFPKLP